MAATKLSSHYQAKGFHVLGLFCLMLLVQKSNGTQFTVGGTKGWTVPTNDSSYSYNQWAEHTRFQIGDSLLFAYKQGQDSVLEVTKEDYANCSTDSPKAKYDDGHTVFTFDKSGPHYFISGNKDNCLKNEKLVIIVLADRSNGSSNTTPASPPSPSSSDNVPSPSPSGEESPPSGTVEINPTPSPVSNPPKNAASSTFSSSIGVIGAVFAASSLALVF